MDVHATDLDDAVGVVRHADGRLEIALDAQASQLENLNCFGLGNELSDTPPEGQGEDCFDTVRRPARTGSSSGAPGL